MKSETTAPREMTTADHAAALQDVIEHVRDLDLQIAEITERRMEMIERREECAKRASLIFEAVSQGALALIQYVGVGEVKCAEDPDIRRYTAGL